MRPVFADPKTDIVFQRIFGEEPHKPLLIALLNDLLMLSSERRIVDLEYLSPHQAPRIEGKKVSIVDVKCVDAQGTRYIVEMQVLNVEGFDKRLVYNACKAYVGQLQNATEYPTLNDVVAVAICDFSLWPNTQGRTSSVPMLSRWRMSEEATGATTGFSQVRYVVLELPKYAAGNNPVSMVEKWAYFFREAERLKEIPDVLGPGPVADAMEVARTWKFTDADWEAYDRACMEEQDARGAITLAERVGRAEGEAAGKLKGLAEGEAAGKLRGLADAVVSVLELRGLVVSAEYRGRLAGCQSADALSGWLAKALEASTVEDVFRVED